MASMAMQNLDTLIYDAAASLDEGLFFFRFLSCPLPPFFFPFSSFGIYWTSKDTFHAMDLA
jgi:hypothetical protein